MDRDPNSFQEPGLPGPREDRPWRGRIILIVGFGLLGWGIHHFYPNLFQ